MKDQNRQGGDRFADYSTVAERVLGFYKKYPNGRIITEIVSHDAEVGSVVVRAYVYHDDAAEKPKATGHASETRADGYVNRTNYLENCETSAVGRALALAGFATSKSLASRDEVERAEAARQALEGAPQGSQPEPQGWRDATPQSAPQTPVAAPQRPQAAPQAARGQAEAAEAPQSAPAGAGEPQGEPQAGEQPPPAGEGDGKPGLGFIRGVLSELNKLGDTFSIDGRTYPKWTGGSLDAFVNKRYQVTRGVKDLNDSTREDLQRHLAARLESVRKTKERAGSK